MRVALGSALVCCISRRATATRAAGDVGHDDFVADGFGVGEALGARLGVTTGVGVGLGLGVCTTTGELCVLAGVGATGPSGPDGVGDGEDVDTGGADGVFAAVFVLPPFDVIAPATATPAIAATAVPRIRRVALRVLMRDKADLRRCGRRTGFWCTDPE